MCACGCNFIDVLQVEHLWDLMQRKHMWDEQFEADLLVALKGCFGACGTCLLGITCPLT